MTAYVPAQMGLPNCLVPSVPKIKVNPESCGKPSQIHGFLEMRIKSKETIGWIKFIDKVPFLVFGRDLGACHVFVGHPSVATQHAFAYWDLSSGFCMIQDMESEHGTSINGRTISHMQPTLLQLKDSIRFGNSAHVYIFDYLPPEYRDATGSASPPRPPMPPPDARTEASGPLIPPRSRRMSDSPRRGSDPPPGLDGFRRSPGRDPSSGEFPPRMHEPLHRPGPPGGGRWSPGRDGGEPWRDGRGRPMDDGYDRRPLPPDGPPPHPPGRFHPPPDRRYSGSPPRSRGPPDDDYGDRMRMGAPPPPSGFDDRDMGGRGRPPPDDFDHSRGRERGYGRPDFPPDDFRGGPPRGFDDRDRAPLPLPFYDRGGPPPAHPFDDRDGPRRRHDERHGPLPGAYRGRGRGDFGYHRDREEYRGRGGQDGFDSPRGRGRGGRQRWAD
ncbi:hypothetical protein BWQ96_01269 [Gracilariopsis chorda]|uniref:FHA domain-containing protein n=1 Tax=Gracilariopsis chorda TaxID=448386 RepID=A0A2V3J4K6_9FLOR|nr:hypothetical protein BWQ96_01269 [Gracilariopsis chorda]|eukprot:PXF48927.1 hypothetical protein BWQ96_01269 [Gracilariopsis chorda]